MSAGSDRRPGDARLVDVQRALALFAHALAGRPLQIAAGEVCLSDTEAASAQGDGCTILLPEEVADFACLGENRAAYRIAVLRRVAVLHGGGLEFDLAGFC